MKTNRRQFLELASTAGAWFPFWKSAAKVQEGSSSSDGSVGPANRGRTASATHLPLFDGTSLKGWHVLGPARWQVENGELLGSCDAAEGGWLELDRGFEDFVLRFAFRSSSGEAGVLLRNAPLTWSRYAHPADRGDQTMGIYVPLIGAHAGEMFVLTLDAKGKQRDRTIIPAPPGVSPGGDELSAGMCAPIPCFGINDARGTKSGWPLRPSIHISKPVHEWQQVEISLRGPACPWDTTGVAAGLDARSQFGTLALYVSGSKDARFKELSIFDLRREPLD